MSENDPIARARALLATTDPKRWPSVPFCVPTGLFAALADECERERVLRKTYQAECNHLSEEKESCALVMRDALDKAQELHLECERLRGECEGLRVFALSDKTARIAELEAENAELRKTQIRRCSDYPDMSAHREDCRTRTALGRGECSHCNGSGKARAIRGVACGLCDGTGRARIEAALDSIAAPRSPREGGE